ncbi:DNA-binding CsgD family transcriptional regulator [Microbacterium sp. SORGH_AS 1204]|uniref:helix-turn-helix domain-containing protein n=1 Tax=Microbacterium sp. SORGH_AS_1204 TaxID=3041785 RepID=UPI0027941986|nr:helix-turn-helix transcriptional regulator [Microbacterium sp. SORGH_AS_1204]MDQ1136511.1 DNA-binding CsgD family transcriptional regulator [Microbacterium sp. SORGH_AS_1204]
MPFFGRARENRIADELIGSAGGGACLFTGEPGVGKSALAGHIAAGHDAVVVVASPSERMWPYSGLSAVAAGLGGERRAAVDALLDRGGDWPEHLLAEHLSRTLQLVREEPDVVVVDDIDQLDGASVTVLSYVLGRLRGTGLHVIATSGPLGGRSDFAGMRREVIGRLGVEESLELARAVLGTHAAPAVLRNVVASTGGHPGLLARVRLTPRETVGDVPLPFPLRLADDAAGRRGAGDTLVRDPAVAAVMDLLSVAPVFGHDRLRGAAAALGVEVDALIDDGLVDVHGELARIADPARRLRHLSALSADERHRLHARAATEHAGAYPATVLWHESFADPGIDRERLLVAAVDLAQTGEPSTAVEFAERALAGPLDAAARCRLLVDLGEALVLQGDDVRARFYLRRAGTSSEPAVRARAALAWLRATAATDHVVDDAMLDVAAELDDPRAVERLLCESARLHLWRGEAARARTLLEIAVERGLASVESALVARLLEEVGADVVLPVTVDTGVGSAAAAPPASLEQTLIELSVGIMREEYALVRRRIRVLLDQTPRLAPFWRDQVGCLLVTTEVRGGDPAAAREAVADWRREWFPGRAPDVANILVLASAAALDPVGPGAADLVRQGRDLCRREGTPTLLPWFAVIEGGTALAEGRFDDAVTALRTAKEAVPVDDPSFLRADADLVEALWLSGLRTEARVELAHLEAASARSPRRWTTIAVARSRAVCRSDADGAAAFRAAEAILRTDDAPYERVRLAAARERCLPSSDPPLPTPPSGTNERSRTLTSQEREVVALVGRGLRNREIAASLFISLRTVELRLTGIYRKLGVNSRVQLVALLHGATRS